MAQDARLVLLGYGVTDTLQITVEAQRVLLRAGKAYALSPPPQLRQYLRALRVECVDLGDRFGAGRPYADAYLDVGEFVLRRTGEERPVVLLSQGNPLYLNALNRFLLMQARERELPVEVYPAVSPLDAVVCDLGLDVGAFGLQMFDARRLVARQQRINPAVPLLVLQLAGVGADTVAGAEDGTRTPEQFQPLESHLAQFYPQTQSVTLLNTPGAQNRTARATAPLSRFAELIPHVRPSSQLFIDGVKQ